MERRGGEGRSFPVGRAGKWVGGHGEGHVLAVWGGHGEHSPDTPGHHWNLSGSSHDRLVPSLGKVVQTQLCGWREGKGRRGGHRENCSGALG